MLRLAPPTTRYALEKAAEARKKAQAATDVRARHFWGEIEAKWLHLADSSNFTRGA
jgi:hypothetical protein